jgi:hypothetical protein
VQARRFCRTAARAPHSRPTGLTLFACLPCGRPLKKFQQPKQSEKGPRWVKDKAVFWCKSCNTDFSVVVRKHHCRCVSSVRIVLACLRLTRPSYRHCGHVFCGHCCSNKRTLIKYGYLKPVRLCNKCNASCFKADLLLNAVGLNDINTVTKMYTSPLSPLQPSPFLTSSRTCERRLCSVQPLPCPSFCPLPPISLIYPPLLNAAARRGATCTSPRLFSRR